MVKEGTTRESGPEVWLALETATPMGSVAIWKSGLAIEQTLRIHGTHSELLMPAIDHALVATETKPADISAIVVGSGPGSFTGVRVGASLAKGWAMARGVPLYAYSSLLAVAVGSGVTGPICPMFDARRRQVYAACYELLGEAVSELLAPRAWYIEDLLEEISARGIEPVFSGDGSIVYHESLHAAFKGVAVPPEHLRIPRAASLLWLRRVLPELGLVAEPHAWEPSYVRDWRVTDRAERR